MTRVFRTAAGSRWKGLTLVGALVVGLIVGVVAFAYFTSAGTGSGHASTGTLNAPTGVTVPGTSAGTVAVSWTASTTGGGAVAPQGYYVERNNGATWSAACGTLPTSLAVGTSCNDIGVTNGTYTYRVTAVYNSWTAVSASSGSVVVAVGATHLAFNVQPSNTVAGIAISPSVTVRILDSSNSVVTGDNSTKVTLSIGTNPGGGTLSGTLQQTALSGIVTFSGLSIDKAGTGYTLVASDTTGGGGIHPLTGSTSSTFNITPGAANHIDLSGSAADLASGSTRVLTATIKDANGNTVTSDSSTVVTFAKTAAAGTVSGLGTSTAASGVATKTVTGVLAGSITLAATATSPALPAGTTLTFNVVAGAANHIDLSGSTADLASGSPRALTATIKDAAGNTISSDSSTVVTFATTAGTGTVSGLGTATAASGVASKTVTGVLAGSITLAATATSPALPSGTTVTFNVVAGAANHIDLSGSAADLASGSTRVLTATIKDANGNTVTSDSSTVVTFAKTAGAGTVSGLGTSTAASGVATKTVTGVLAGSITLAATATSPALSAGTTLTFNVVAGVSSKLAFTTSPSNSTGGVAFSPNQPVVAVQDASGNTVTTDTSNVTLVVTTPAGAALTCTANPKAAVAGGATFAGCRIDLAGTYTLTATDGALASAVSSSFTISVGAAAKLGFTQQPSDSGTNVPLGTQPKVAIQDLGGNTVTGNTSSVTLALTTPGGATLTCTTNPLAAVAGVSTFAGCKVDLAGSYTLTATDGALSSAVSNAFTISTPPTVTARTGTAWNLVTTWLATRTGTIITSNASAAVTGTGTSFLSQLAVGDGIYKSDFTTLIGTVLSITDNTHLTLTANAASTNNPAITYSAGRIPTSADAVVVNVPGMTIPNSYNAFANSLTIGTGDSLLTFLGASSTLTVANDVTIQPAGANNDAELALGPGSLSVGGNLAITGAGGNRDAILTITSGSVTVGGNLTFTDGQATLSLATGSVTVAGNLALNDGSLNMSGGAGTFNLAGSMTDTGTFTSGATSTFNFNGTSPQTIPDGEGFANLTINNTSAGGATLSGATSGTDVTGNLSVQSGTFSNGGFAIALANAKSFSVSNGATFKLTGTSAMVTVAGGGTKTFGATSTVDYAGAVQTVSNETYGHLSLSGSGAKAMPGTAMATAGNLSTSGTASATAGAALTVNGNFSVGSGSTFAAGTFSHIVKGNFSNNGTFTASTSTFTFSGTSQQTFSGSGLALNIVTLNNSAGILLSGADLTTGGALTLTSGAITTGANKVIANSTVARTSGFVNGNLQKPVATGTSAPTFEVGTGSTYAPVALTGLAVTVAGNLTASSTSGQQPSYGGSGLSATRYVNRYWTLAAGGGLTVTGYNAAFTFANPGDLVGTTATPVNILKVRKLVSGVWSAPTTSTSSTTTVTGTTFGTTFGDYASGE